MKRQALFLISIMELLIGGLGFSSLLNAQVPQSISYQAIVRDSGGNVLADQVVSFRITFHIASASGSVKYCEKHTATTSTLGLVTLQVGNGIPVNGSFTDIDWSTGVYYLEIEMDPVGGTGYVPMGTTQLISVPYTLFSNDAARIQGNLVSPSEPVLGQVLQWNGTQWAPAAVFGPRCIDYDGNAYPAITIGTQVWMAENLRVTHYRNGDPIPLVTDDSEWEGLTSGAYCWHDNDQEENALYGALYNWFAVDDNRGLCPTGWHVPSDEEWTAFATYLGGGDVAGGKTKSTSTLWFNPNKNATNSSGFTGLPGGCRDWDDSFDLLSFNGFWWASTEVNDDEAWIRYLSYSNSSIGLGNSHKGTGFSVRCVRNY